MDAEVLAISSYRIAQEEHAAPGPLILPFPILREAKCCLLLCLKPDAPQGPSVLCK
jgi:hypothetical protein